MLLWPNLAISRWWRSSKGLVVVYGRWRPSDHIRLLGGLLVLKWWEEAGCRWMS